MVMLVADVSWLNVQGLANGRDVGGLPLAAGGSVRTGRLLRSDNLQSLTPADVRMLVDQLSLRSVVDLRAQVEVDGEGPGPIFAEPTVAVHHLSLFPESGATSVDGTVDTGTVLPWQDEQRGRSSVTDTYVAFLRDRPDSVVAALRLIASTSGATLVHCAAGKDRTGVIVALALAEVGVDRDAIVADYVATAERIDAILVRLQASPTYAGDATLDYVDKHRPRATTMIRFLDHLDAEYAGAGQWLRRHGWTEPEAAALRDVLVDNG
jgi:protein-tyrosine phosphatase